MANEGSTKPTYSELEAHRDAWKRDCEHEKARADAVRKMGGIAFQYFDKDSPLVALNITAHELREELARVRGLLQRGIALMNGMGGKHGSLGQMDGWRILFDTLEEAQGAEKPLKIFLAINLLLVPLYA